MWVKRATVSYIGRSSLEVEHSLGKGEVEGPIPSCGTMSVMSRSLLFFKRLCVAESGPLPVVRVVCIFLFFMI